VTTTAQKLILDLISATSDHRLHVRVLIVVAALFDITENSVRVALARLVSRGLLSRNGRGAYALAAGGRPVQRHVASWSLLEERMVVWRATWCGVLLSRKVHAGRSAAKRRQRALDFWGLRLLEPGLWIRPDNLVGGVRALRQQLGELGLDEDSRVFAISELDGVAESRARALWSSDSLGDDYRSALSRLKKSARGLDELPLERAVVESFVEGGRVIHRLAFDPLLPEEILPGAARRALVEEMRSYDQRGRRIWAAFAESNGMPELVMPVGPPPAVYAGARLE
jgi:phenylacetic acid degradation operon negative regulatory protein